MDGEKKEYLAGCPAKLVFELNTAMKNEVE